VYSASKFAISFAQVMPFAVYSLVGKDRQESSLLWFVSVLIGSWQICNERARVLFNSFIMRLLVSFAFGSIPISIIQRRRDNRPYIYNNGKNVIVQVHKMLPLLLYIAANRPQHERNTLSVRSSFFSPRSSTRYMKQRRTIDPARGRNGDWPSSNCIVSFQHSNK